MKIALAGLKPNFLKIKDKAQNLDLKKMTSLLKRIDKIYFIQGLAATAILYILMFGYVYFSSENTLNKLKEKIPSHTSSLEFVNHIASNGNSTPHKQDANITDLIIEGLYQKTAQGLLPTIRKSDNLTSFRAYQHPFPLNNVPNKPIVTLVVNDYGLSQKQSKTALDILPSEVSLILNPYADLPNEWIKMAQNKGHEIWLNLPIQNENILDQGKNTLFHHVSLPEKIAILYRVMTQTQGYTGLASFTDAQTLTTPEHYTQLMNEIYERGLGFLETNPNAPKLLRGKALNMGAPYIKADTTIINMTGDKQSFDELERITKKNGHVTAIIPPYPETLKKLAVWIEKIGKVDYTIAPVSVIYDLPFYQPDMNNASTPKTLSPNDHIEPEHNAPQH
ncbi:MAG: divergent polysaccharide deacetylase family protein [Alphaproteobacteria bacterium]